VSSDTNILQAMQLMTGISFLRMLSYFIPSHVKGIRIHRMTVDLLVLTDKHIRHVPVIDHKVVGMISIVDVVRAVVEQQQEEVKRLNAFIKGDYY